MISKMLGKDLMKVVFVLQALAAIIVGLLVFDVNLFANMNSGSLAAAVKPLQVIFGLAGIAGLLELIVGCGSCCD